MPQRLAMHPQVLPFLAVNCLDIVSTWLATLTGLAEGNGLPAMLLAAGGPAAMYGFKAAITLLVLSSVLRLGPYYPGAWGAMRAGTWLISVAVLLNTLQTIAA